MNYSEILEKWAKYTNYNPEQRTFNVTNYSYELHEANKKIERILEEYDKTGALAIIKAKITFEKMMKNSSYNALEYFQNPNIIKEDKEIWDIFHSEEVLQIEESYIDSINKLSDKIIGKYIIGERNNEDILNDLFEATDIVINSLDACNRDLFTKGNEVLPVTRISTHIHLFETLAECLIALENTVDGLYLCYINCGGTANGYFSFFLKSNGNLLSINERADESYVGQHSKTRNGRWMKSKQYELFPYEYIFNYTNHDYKGYAKNHLIDEEKLAFFELGHNVYLPIIIAMLMINNQYVGTIFDMEVKYVDSLLPINLKELPVNNKEIMIIGNSNLIKHHESVDLSFDLEKIINGEYSKEFNSRDNPNKSKKETGVFENSNQILVDLWGDGFEYDESELYKNNSLRITSGEDDNDITPEFVGSKSRMRLQGYYEIRKRLADYIRNRMYEEWVSIGKTSAIKKWYLEAINNNKDKIERLIIEKYLKIQNGEESIDFDLHTANKDILDIYYQEQKYPSGYTLVLNQHKDVYKDKYICMKTGAICSMFFTFNPKDWKQLELLLGVEVPKIVKGWIEKGHFGIGNSILDATDLVTQVGTPFERYESRKYEKCFEEQNVYFDFRFSIGFSKRGINQLVKKLN